MRPQLVAPLAALLAASLPALSSEAAGKKLVPARIAQARYVALGYFTGAGFVSEQQALGDPDVFPEDRRALQSIRDELEGWDHYVLTVQPRDAEILIAVRSARRLGITAGSRVGTGRGGPGPTGFGPIAGAEVSTPDDLFLIFESRGGAAGTELWRVQGKGALSGTPPRAFEDFRTEVERAPTAPRKP